MAATETTMRIEKELDKKTRAALSDLLARQGMIGPEDVVRTLTGVVANVSEQKGPEIESKLGQDLRALLTCADKLKF